MMHANTRMATEKTEITETMTRVRDLMLLRLNSEFSIIIRYCRLYITLDSIHHEWELSVLPSFIIWLGPSLDSIFDWSLDRTTFSIFYWHFFYTWRFYFLRSRFSFESRSRGWDFEREFACTLNMPS